MSAIVKRSFYDSGGARPLYAITAQRHHKNATVRKQTH